ncbi:MAG: GNAT family N-acetyltransferase [Pseudomonadota bacterium]
MPPTLKTDRLTLRSLRLSDAGRVQALCGEIAISRWLSRVPHPYPDGEAERFITQCLDEACQVWGIEIIERPGIVGCIGLEGPSDHTILGYWLGQSYWGRGLVTEAAREAVRFGFDQMGRDVLRSGLFQGNARSLRIQQKLGFQIKGRRKMYCKALNRELEHIDTELTRADWEAAQLIGMGGTQDA